LLGDKGDDGDAVRQEIADHGGEVLIPTKQKRKIQQTVDKAIYGCVLINSPQPPPTNFAAFVILATIRIWIRFVHTTWMACGDIEHG
jgi:hypothetical protein